jgi:hypothetical protein
MAPRTLGATGITTQDYSNVLMGALIAASTFMMGKIVVENIVRSRREHFDKKGQPPAAVKARETTGDGVMKLVGVAFSLWQLSQELPEVMAEAKKYFP